MLMMPGDMWSNMIYLVNAGLCIVWMMYDDM